jgi:four helix bundle protein
MHDFRKLRVWQRGMDFVTDIYEASGNFPRTEQFGLTDQIRRSAINIPLNISEGAGAGSTNEFQRFLSYARRSTYEVMSALEIAKRLGYCRDEELMSLLDKADQIAAMIVGLSRKLV